MEQLKLFVVLVIVYHTTSLAQSLIPSSCHLNDSRKTPGICKDITKCEYAIGNLDSDIPPTPCNNGNSRKEVCCPTHPRISEQKCGEYMNILKSPLPGSKAGNPLKDIVCEQFLMGTRISGGQNAFPRQFPFSVALGYEGGSTPNKIHWRCGGVLISDEWVLTASHCVKTRFGPPTKILLGDINLTTKTGEKVHSSGLILNVIKVIPHPDFKTPILYNDIALLKLSSKVNLSREILPACLPKPQDRLDRKLVVEVTGWGQIGDVGMQSNILQTVQLSKFKLMECSKYFQEDQITMQRIPKGILRSQFCAGDKVGIKDSCQGDSGGPAVVTTSVPCIFYVVGLVSFGGMCGYQQPGVYTNVQSYIDWIEEIVWPIKSKVNQNKDFLFFPTIIPMSTTTETTIKSLSSSTTTRTISSFTTRRTPTGTPSMLFMADSPSPEKITTASTTISIMTPTPSPMQLTSSTHTSTRKSFNSASGVNEKIQKMTSNAMKSEISTSLAPSQSSKIISKPSTPEQSFISQIPMAYLQKLCDSSEDFKHACQGEDFSKLLSNLNTV